MRLIPERLTPNKVALLGLITGAALGFRGLVLHKAHADDIYDYMHQGQQQTQTLSQARQPCDGPVHCQQYSDHLGHLYLNCSDGTRATSFVGFPGHVYTLVIAPDGTQHNFHQWQGYPR